MKRRFYFIIAAISTIIVIGSFLIVDYRTLKNNNYKNIQEHKETTKTIEQYRFEIGDIVYLKPDSTRAVIEDRWIETTGTKYTVYYFSDNVDGEKNMNQYEFDERLIY